MRTPTVRRILTLATLPTVWLMLVSGCGQDGPATGPGPSATDFRAVLESGGDFERVEPSENVTVGPSEEVVEPDGTRYLCTSRTYSSVQAPLEYATFDPNAEVIYPGSLLQGATLANATPDPISVARAGGTISIDLNNGSEGVSVTVPEVRQSTIREAMNEILRNNTGVGAARFVFESDEVQSREQLAAFLRVNVRTFTTDFNAALQFSEDREYSRWLVKLNQTFYTMSYDLPTSTSQIFAPSVQPADLARYVAPGNPAAYISSVTYGRIFYLLVETTESREELEASVHATYTAAVAGGGIDAGARYVTSLRNVRIKVFALGGDPGLALATFNGDFEAVRRFLTEGGDVYTGRPLSYVLRSVKDNTTVNVKVATEYDVRDCRPVDASLPNPIVWYSGTFEPETTEELGARAVRRWKDKWGNAAMDAVPQFRRYCGHFFTNVVNGRGHAVYFRSGSESDAALRFSGLRFRSTDYTIFVLARNSTDPGPNRTVLFTWGDGRDPGQGLVLGYKNNSTVLMSHGTGLTLEAPIGAWGQDGFRLYTFRFSRQEGMSIYVNGVRQATDASLTTPLAAFTGATLGCADERRLPHAELQTHIAEFKAVASALSDDVRARVELEIMTEYGL